MITFAKSNISIGVDEVTPKKIDAFIVMFSTPSKGFLNAWLQGGLLTEDGYLQLVENVLPLQFEFFTFEGKDLLLELHNIYIAKLTELNPGMEFNAAELVHVEEPAELVPTEEIIEE